MKNLLEETLAILEKNGKTEKDVVWVGTQTQKTTWDKFQRVANKIYDDGFGAQAVAEEIMVVGKNWWLERHEYDGSEWWEYKELPKEPTETISGDEIEKIVWK